jgi:hypothetical protein
MPTTRRGRPWDNKKSAFEEAAVSVLRASKKPLSLAEIMSRMIDAELVKPTGKTPVNSLYTIVRRATERSVKHGEALVFVPHKDDSGRVTYHLGAQPKQ